MVCVSQAGRVPGLFWLGDYFLSGAVSAGPTQQQLSEKPLSQKTQSTGEIFPDNPADPRPLSLSVTARENLQLDLLFLA